MVLDQSRAPLFEALRQYVTQVKAPFHVPGHKMGRGAEHDWRRFIGINALEVDLTEAPGLDDLHAPTGVIAEAEALAAEAFGAQQSYFLVGGSTAGLHALILASCHPGDTVAVPRNVHRSVLGALILAGVKPRWLQVSVDRELGASGHPAMEEITHSLDDVAALVLVHPTYFGSVGPLGRAIQEAHHRNIPVIVDEAHGSHFHFHPALPPSALSLGADATVQSIHKTGGSLTQSSLCHLGQSGGIKPERLREMLRLVQTTSPSYLLMASLDTARRDLAVRGAELWGTAIDRAQSARRLLNGLPGIRVPETDDPTRLVVGVRGRGINGQEAARHLWSRGVAVEFSGPSYFVAVVTPGDSPESITLLVDAVASLPMGTGAPKPVPALPIPEVAVTPREAYLGAKQPIPLMQSVGRIAAEVIAPYPPGIPVLVPGERITTPVIEYLLFARKLGHHLQGPTDPSLATIQVLKE